MLKLLWGQDQYEGCLSKSPQTICGGTRWWRFRCFPSNLTKLERIWQEKSSKLPKSRCAQETPKLSLLPKELLKSKNELSVRRNQPSKCFHHLLLCAMSKAPLLLRPGYLFIYLSHSTLSTERCWKLRLWPRWRNPTPPTLDQRSTVWGSASVKWRARCRVPAPHRCLKRWRANTRPRWQRCRSRVWEVQWTFVDLHNNITGLCFIWCLYNYKKWLILNIKLPVQRRPGWRLHVDVYQLIMMTAFKLNPYLLTWL